jgi:hypothetical protein
MPYTMGAAGPSVVAMSVLVAWVSVHDILQTHTAGFRHDLPYSPLTYRLAAATG